MSEASITASPQPRVALWIVVFAGPALRTSLLGCLLVMEEAVGETLALGAGTLAVLVEAIIFGGLLAVFLVPPLVAKAGLHRVTQAATVATLLILALCLLSAPLMSAGATATIALFVVATLLGFFGSVPAPTTQILLSNATNADALLHRSLQSLWSAGQPAGFIVASMAGGVLIERFGWWTALIVPLIVTLVLAAALLDRKIAPIPSQEQTHPGPGAIGLFWIVTALVAFEVWSMWGSLTSWFSPGVLAVLIAMGVSCVVAVRHLRRSTRPAISVAPFSVAGFATAALILFLYQFPTTAEFEILLLGDLAHMSAAEIGNRTAIGNLAQIVGTAFAAALLLRHQIGLALFIGFALTIAGLGGYALYPWWDGFAFAAFTRAVAGLGAGLLTPCLFVLALNRMPVSLQIAAGTWLVLAIIGGTEVGLALFDIVIELATNAAGSAFAGYVAVEIAQLALGVVTAILTLLLITRGMLPLTAAPVTALTGSSAHMQKS